MSVCMSMPIYSTNIYIHMCVYVYIYIGTYTCEIYAYMDICILYVPRFYPCIKILGPSLLSYVCVVTLFSQALACFFMLLALCFEEHK